MKSAAASEPLSVRSSGTEVNPGPGNGAVSAPPPRRVYLNDIRDLAYRKWASAGQPGGDCVRFWLEAEAELLQGGAG